MQASSILYKETTESRYIQPSQQGTCQGGAVDVGRCCLHTGSGSAGDACKLGLLVCVR